MSGRRQSFQEARQRRPPARPTLLPKWAKPGPAAKPARWQRPPKASTARVPRERQNRLPRRREDEPGPTAASGDIAQCERSVTKPHLPQTSGSTAEDVSTSATGAWPIPSGSHHRPPRGRRPLGALHVGRSYALDQRVPKRVAIPTRQTTAKL